MNLPIGVFDSGIGGLTVVKELTRLLPQEDIVYFGDTARVPYGTRSSRIIKQYALEDAAFLSQFNTKLQVIACNSVSAVAIDLLKSNLSIPVTGVIIPGVSAAVQSTRNKKIGIIGTTATVNSKAYHTQIKQLDESIEIFSQACPMLVALVEEGWISGEITELTILKYLKPLIEKGVDTIILGCTHFPVLAPTIQKVISDKIALIDSGKETAKVVKKILDENKMNSDHKRNREFKFYVSDIPFRFNEIGTLFLGKPVVSAEQVDFDKFLMQVGSKIYKQLHNTE